MRISASLAFLALVSATAAQSPLTTLAGGTNQGNVGGTMFFIRR